MEVHHTPPATPSATKPGSSPASQQRPRPTHEEIALRAYENFLRRGHSGGQSDGNDKEDWYKAEQELLSKP